MTAPELSLLAEVSWGGAPLPGGRTHALLAALAAAGGRPVGEDRLIEEVWGPDDVPANPAKALQVVVSRVRALTAPEVVTRADRGYRLGLAVSAVDAMALHEAVVDAREAEGRRDLLLARDRSRGALALPAPAGEVDGPLGELRQTAARHRVVATGVLGRALSGLGDHEEALPLLRGSTLGASGDEATLAALLRSTAAVEGAPAALERYEQHRAELAERLGVDPGPTLQAVHAELLAADRPVREGLRFESTSLVGRDEDIRALRAAVRASRVVSILGPGGLGKTRLAHLLGREAEQPVVRFVELVGVASPEDVVGEVGSALGVRDSVAGRRVLTPEQRHDLRARTAAALDQAPTLLILDNCEHVVGAVAELVAYLVATASRLRVVTTTRAPLAIAAERVFPLGQLDEEAGVDLFGQRARSARPGVVLDAATVRAVVRRLDGLPLAIELAAAKVRVMSVEDVDRRLDDRFTLLRGGDRSAPSRHQTLVAVIDWSWNLLTESERRALRWLSVFHDGFTLAGAEALLGQDSLAEVGSLVDQSLLTVLDADGSVRFRMLETVREFGRMQLVGAGEDGAAQAAQLQWACAYAARVGDDLWSPRQVRAMHELAAEENNLADCLREAMAVPDPRSSALVVSALGAYWTVKGENARVIALTSALEHALDGWEPAEEDIDIAVGAATMTVLNTMAGEVGDSEVCLRILREHGAQSSVPRLRGMARMLCAQDPSDPAGTLARLAEISAGPDRDGAMFARMWAAHFRENEGDPEGAIVEAECGLELLGAADEGPWMHALLHGFLAALHAQLGRWPEAAEHARAALPVIDEIEATDDAVQMRSLLASYAMSRGELDEAERLIDDIVSLSAGRPASNLGGPFATGIARAELALARGRLDEGLALYRRAVDQLGDIRYPGLGAATGFEPWTLFGESAALAAYAVHTEAGSGDDGADLYDRLLAKVSHVLDPTRPMLDIPIAGLVLFALGTWGLLREAFDTEDAVRLLVLAEAFAYARYVLTMDLDAMLAQAEARAPGVVAAVRPDYAGRRGPDLLDEARAVTSRVVHP